MFDGIDLKNLNIGDMINKFQDMAKEQEIKYEDKRSLYSESKYNYDWYKKYNFNYNTYVLSIV